MKSSHPHLLVLCALFFCFAKVALSRADQAPLPSSPQELNFSDLVIPSDLGAISQVHDAPILAPSAKRLILLQDTHVNEEAQRHIAKILDRLASEYGIRLVLVEGGDGDAGLAWLRELGSQASRDKVAERYLKEGLLSGAEYLDIVSDHPLIVWGVDDEALYDVHFNLFGEVEELRERIGAPLAALRQAVDAVRAQTTNEALKTFEAKEARFDREELAFTDYLTYLVSEGERVGVSVSAYPTLARVLKAAGLEAAINHDLANEEQQEFLRALSRGASDEDLSRLKDAVAQFKAGSIEPAAFYQELAAIASRAGIDLVQFPNLSRYMTYIQLKAGLESKALWSELEEVQARIKAQLAGSSSEAELAAVSEAVGLYQRLLELSWSPQDYAAYRAHQADWRLSRLVPILRTHAERLGVPLTIAGDGAALDEPLASAARFYEAAAIRDGEMVRRALEKMTAEGERVAVMVAGGFHTDHLAALFAEQGVQVAVVTPWAGKDDDPRRYAEILKRKHEAKLQTPITKSQTPDKHQ